MRRRQALYLCEKSLEYNFGGFGEDRRSCVHSSREFLKKIVGKVAFQWYVQIVVFEATKWWTFWQKKGVFFFKSLLKPVLHYDKLEMIIFRQSFRRVTSQAAGDEFWIEFCGLHYASDSPRAATVAMFRLMTGHDCLYAYLFRFNLSTSPNYALCDLERTMTAVIG
ncbi:hypothetical protein CDAR_268611 [Caerostris darwini]|uniref:Uncharacterized protein n=1 Tax=Caerostris darwini TaxID=1538125 RepID=A0AAV4X4H3_9ARAC|nr:hypothetical protein CDAR_268611 [Caerostris darwini]